MYVLMKRIFNCIDCYLANKFEISEMKALHFLKWPLILLLVGYLAFLIGNFTKGRHWPPAEGLIIAGYLIIIIAIVWTIIKFIFLKPPEEDID